MKKFAVIGNPIEHSKSPQIHTSAYKALQWDDATYEKILLEDGKKLKECILSNGLSGVNITVPFKEDAFNICDELDEFAQNIGAVNTIVVKNNKFYGYNTDAPGFVQSVKNYEYKSVLILGAGGTARAIAYALKDKNPTVANRSQSRLEFFEKNNFNIAIFEDLNANNKYDIVINTTSAGLKDDLLPMDKNKLTTILTNANVAADCIYGKLTPFLSVAKECNIKYQDGRQMLIEQAFLAFQKFFDTKNFNLDTTYTAMNSSI